MIKEEIAMVSYEKIKYLVIIIDSRRYLIFNQSAILVEENNSLAKFLADNKEVIKSFDVELDSLIYAINDQSGSISIKLISGSIIKYVNGVPVSFVTENLPTLEYINSDKSQIYYNKRIQLGYDKESGIEFLK
jgi:hypothetical protein